MNDYLKEYFFDAENKCFSGIKSIDLSEVHSLLFYYFDKDFYSRFFKMVSEELSYDNQKKVMNEFLFNLFVEDNGLSYGGNLEWIFSIIEKNGLNKFTNYVYTLAEKESPLTDNKEDLEIAYRVYPSLKNHFQTLFLFSYNNDVLDYVLSSFKNLDDFMKFQSKINELSDPGENDDGYDFEDFKIEKIKQRFSELEKEEIENKVNMDSKENTNKELSKKRI